MDAGGQEHEYMDSLLAYLPFRERIAAVLDPRFYPLDWLDQQVFAGRMQVFVDGDSCLLTELRSYPTGFREVHAMVAVGEAATIAGTLARRAEEYGRQNGCGMASVASRPGWAKALPDYAVYQVTLRKEL